MPAPYIFRVIREDTMTPAERQLVAELFDRLAALEDAQRDSEAERAIRDGLRQAPNAVYALVQTALVQDEALRRANARIQELEAELGMGNAPQRQGGFLDTMRDGIFGRREEQRGSVPSVRPGGAPMGAPSGYGSGPFGASSGPGGQMQPPPEPGRGGSFLGTAAAAAAGMIGGSLLLDSIRGMTGGRSGGLTNPAAAAGQEAGSPWGNAAGGGGDDLGRQLGRDDIGRSGSGNPDPFSDQGQNQGQGLLGNAGAENAGHEDAGHDGSFGHAADDGFDLDGGFDGGDGGGD
jgi:hypothetical protein